MNNKQEYIDLRNEVNNLGDNLPPANIIIAGVTGSGKSTLINAVFGEELAKTGTGAAITAKIDVYTKIDVPVKVWDTVGLELRPEVTDTTIENVREIIRKKNENKEDKFDRIHAIWYCIQATGHRFQSEEVKFISELKGLGVPFIIVLTKCISKKKDAEFEQAVKDILQKKKLDIPILQVLAVDWEVELDDEVRIIRAKGLSELVNLTADKLPDFICESFVAAQQVDKVIKRQIAEKVIVKYTREAKKGILNKIPIASLFATNSSAKKMFNEIAELYNTQLEEHDIDKIYESTSDKFAKINQLKMIMPINVKIFGKFPEAEKIFASVKNEVGFEGSENEFSVFQKAAQLIAYTGYTWIFSIEEYWDELVVALTKEDKKNIIDKMVKKMKECWKQ